MPEGRRWQVERVLQLDALPWLLEPTRVKERVIQRGRRYVTWNYIRRSGGTLGCKARTVDSAHHNKQCLERFQVISEKKRELLCVWHRISRRTPAVMSCFQCGGGDDNCRCTGQRRGFNTSNRLCSHEVRQPLNNPLSNRSARTRSGTAP